MEIRDWLSIITSWVAIGISIWLGLRDSDNNKKQRRK